MDIGLDVFLEALLIVFLAKHLFCFIDFEMICKKIIVLSADKLATDDLWYVREILIIKNSIKVFAAFLQFFSSDFFSFEVGSL